MKESSTAYLPQDRLVALAGGTELSAVSRGAVLFADISGFTPLTEAYEAHFGPRQGGEELTRVLNEVYASLIGEVENVRGSVIGFAGDAITCWLEGDDGSRAVTCALSLQAGMSKFKAIPSPGGGTIALGLKAAVTHGTVRRFAVGCESVQKVDVLAGDPVYRVAEIEQLAERGDVLIDEATRSNLGKRVQLSGGRIEASGNTTAWKVEEMEKIEQHPGWPAVESLGIDQEVLEPWMISAIRHRLNSGMGEFLTELRPATALFLKFGGIDFEKDSKADHKLDTFFSRVQRIVDSHEGVVHQLTVGDKGSFLYAAFGAPISHEDDTARALSVALKLSALEKEMDFIQSIQIGIGRGSTRSGAYGGPTRRTYGVLGDQVNLSARLMAKAAPGQILVSESAAREGLNAFRLNVLEPIRVKGKSMPVQVYELKGTLDKSGDGSEKPAYAIPMVGRREPFALIKDCLEKAAGGTGQVVRIEANAGLGKTRLIEEAVHFAESQGIRVLRGECPTFGSNTIYTPWWRIWKGFFGISDTTPDQESIRLLLQRLSEINPELKPRLPVLSPVLNIPIQDNELTRTFDTKLKRASLEALLVDCLRHASTSTPHMIVLEDAHAIDPVSRDLLRMLIQAIARLRVVILIAHRPVEEHGILGDSEEMLEYLKSIHLAEFSSEESIKLIRCKFDQLYPESEQVPGDIVRKIASRTGGNPFYIEEVMNWIHHEGINIASTDSMEIIDLPDSLYSLVLSRMDQLDENSRVTMKVASVVGRLFRAAIIWGIYPELGGEEPVRESLEILARREFTVPEEGSEEIAYLFKHVVTHEVAYESLPKELRSRLHEAIGQFIEYQFPARSQEILDLLAFHYGRSTNTDKQRKFYLLAGDAARKAYANSSATHYYQSVLPLLDDVDQLPVLRNLGKVLEFSGDWDTAMENYRKALEMAERLGRAIDMARCQLRIGDMLRKQGKFDEAENWLKHARKTFEDLDEESGIGQALHSAGTLAAQSGNYDRAKELYRESLKIRRRLGDQSQVASLLSNIGIIVRFQGDISQALSLQQESLAIRRELADPWAIGNSLNNLGMAKRYNGDFEGARKHLEEGVRILKKVGDRAEIANTLNSLAEVALDQKDMDSCEQYLQQSLALTRELGNLRAIAFLLEAFAANALFQKDPERCLTLSGAADALRKSIGAPLPDSDQARIDETVDLARQAYHGDTHDCFSAGATLPLSGILDLVTRS